ncbi:MAG: nucleotide pyrophosphohydrolase [Candidatus Hydrogenedentes bacterium]|nr:nucleotide pyrophosphohydrolase [Candidatus Hydrogenedentota bacterium]
MSGEQDTFSRLIRLAMTLRSEEGCPWDRAQDLASLAQYVMAEAGELQEAVCARDTDHVREEIGDVLFSLLSMVVLAEENGDFSLRDLLGELEAKIVRRHPHVFGEASAKSIEEACQHWNEVKKSEMHRTRKRKEVK